MNELLELLQNAGHTDFRDARGPMGFSQRQGGGKFTRDEARGFIDQLQEAEDQRNAPPLKLVSTGSAESEPPLRGIPTGVLAAELRRRGCTVTER